MDTSLRSLFFPAALFLFLTSITLFLSLPLYPPFCHPISSLLLQYLGLIFFSSSPFPLVLSLPPSLLSLLHSLCDPAVFLLYLPQEPLSFPAGPDTLGSDG